MSKYYKLKVIYKIYNDIKNVNINKVIILQYFQKLIKLKLYTNLINNHTVNMIIKSIC